MERRTRNVCGGDHRIALVAMRDEVSRYWRTTALLAATCGAGAGLPPAWRAARATPASLLATA